MSKPVTYIGRFAEVATDGVPGVVKKGETVEVSDALAKSLLAQDENWAAGKKSDVKTDSEGA